MIILTIRTDNPQAELGLYDGRTQLAYEVWEAHRQLAETIHTKIDSLLRSAEQDLHGVQGIVTFQGPGSFTGLRIGLSVANALAAALQVPVVGMQHPGWIQAGVDRVLRGESDVQVLPEYGAPVHITPQKK